MNRTLYGVLIADIVASSKHKNLRSLLGDRLAIVTKIHMKLGLIRLPYGITAGDEFQTVTDNLDHIPQLIIDLRRQLRPLTFRIGIGIGRIPGRIQAPVNRLGGQAFQHARGALNNINKSSFHKFQVLTAFRSSKTVFDTTANLVYKLHDTLIQNITTKQWKTIDAYWITHNLEDAAKLLKLDISTVSRNMKRGYFWQIEETLNGMKGLIKVSFK